MPDRRPPPATGLHVTREKVVFLDGRPIGRIKCVGSTKDVRWRYVGLYPPMESPRLARLKWALTKKFEAPCDGQGAS